MRVHVAKVDREQIARLIFDDPDSKLSDKDKVSFNNCMMLTASLWVGSVDGKLACTWGLIPPTLMSDQAYLWLYTNEQVANHEFLFIRYSQIAVQDMLKEFPTIVGHTKVELTKAIRWLKWLGAEFGDYEGQLVPFVIRKK